MPIYVVDDQDILMGRVGVKTLLLAQDDTPDVRTSMTQMSSPSNLTKTIPK